MKLVVDWSRPVMMKLSLPGDLVYRVDLSRLPDDAGIYVFGRRWGNSFEALYVGKALNIRKRVHGQLNNLRLMQHVRKAKWGRRVILAAVLLPRPGQKIERCLPILERTLIRYFLSEGHDLVNIPGTLLRQHEVDSIHRPKHSVPARMYLDRAGKTAT